MALNLNLDKSIQNSAELAKLESGVSQVKNIIINFLIPLICLGISAGAVLLYTYPRYKELPELKNQVIEKESKAAELQSKLTVLNNISDYQSVISENSALVNDVIPNEARVPQLLTQIDTIAKESGLKVSRLSYAYSGSSSNPDSSITTAPVSDVTHTFISVNMTVGGSYTQLQAFFESIENSARMVEIENYRYSSGDKSDSSGLLDVTLNLKSPYLYVVSSAVTDEPVALNIQDKDFLDYINRLKSLKFYRIGVDEVINVPESSQTP